MKPLTYEEWDKGRGSMFGTKAIVTDKLVRSGDIWKSQITIMIAHTLSQALAENGLNPKDVTLVCERDVELQGTELSVIVKGEKEPSCIPYISIAHQAWVESNVELEKWEHKSLWGYLKYWFKRTFGGKS